MWIVHEGTVDEGTDDHDDMVLHCAWLSQTMHESQLAQLAGPCKGGQR